jgi:hypothetical protein
VRHLPFRLVRPNRHVGLHGAGHGQKVTLKSRIGARQDTARVAGKVDGAQDPSAGQL